MIALLIATLFAMQDDRRDERERMEMLKRVTPSVGAVPATPQQLWTTSPGVTYAEALGSHTIFAPTVSSPRAYATQALSALSTREGAPGTVHGFFIDDKGTFLTVSDALKGFRDTVKLADGRTVKARVITREERVGLAVLHLDTGDATTALAFGDSAAVVAGRTVIVVASADGTPVLRKVAVIGRSRGAIDSYSVEDFIHLDYAALPGDVGAAVLDLDGALVGILAEPAYESSGNGREVPRRAYVIPVATIKAFLAKRDGQGRFEVGILGVTLKDDSAFLKSLVARGPAEKAGLQAGDVITHIDGVDVRDRIDVERRTKFRAREEVEVTVKRGDASIKVKVTVGVWEAPKPEPEPKQQVRDRLGIEVVELTDDLRKFLDLGDRKGVVIQRVEAGSLGEQAGLRKGDAIVMIDTVAVDSVDSFLKKARALPTDGYVVFETWREGKRVPVVLRMK